MVRFSTELDRPAASSLPNVGDFGGSRESPGRKHADGPGLSVITSNESSTFLGEGTVISPPDITSPPGAGETPKRAGSFPLSPKTRSRGWSLRRNMFNRNMDDASQAARGSIPFDAITNSDKTSGSDKKRDHIVTVSPRIEEFEIDDSQASFKKGKGLQGLSALPEYDSWVRERARHNAYLRRIRAGYHKLRKIILRIQEIPPSVDGRYIELDASRKKALTDERTGRFYIGNTIRSTRYTLWSFLPRQLFAQFSKLANFYFLCISILQMIPNLSTTGTYTTIIPLLFFVALSMGKEGYDDFRRYKLDKTENNRDADVLHAYQPVEASEVHSQGASNPVAPIHWAKKKWHDLQVGDIVKLDRDDPAPADLVLLHSDGPNNIAYIETMALDGETNLKGKQATTEVAKRCDSLERIAACRAEFVVEDPNLDLYNFEGRVLIAGEAAPLTNNEIIYRGSVLRNTPQAIGMVIYTGEECKIRMNANKNPRIKAPALQSIVNKVVIVIAVFVVLLAIFNTVAYQIWSADKEQKSWYLQSAKVAFFPILASFIVMFNTLLPLSLYVSLEIVKVAQMFLMNDVDMYDPVSNTPFEARTSTINEELGQISYIFSDKTGTLTDNSMKFRKLSVAGTAWIHDLDLRDDKGKKKLIHKKRNKGKKPMKKGRVSEADTRKSGLSAFNADRLVEDEAMEDSQWRSSTRPKQSQQELKTEHMIRYIQVKPHTIFARKARLFLLSIAICHTCLPERKEDGSMEFQASSPDELALVKAAQELGFLLINRDAGTMTLKYTPSPDGIDDGLTETFQILDVIEFSSKRKRMSITVRFPDGRICLFCKGADSVVMQRLRHARLANEKVVEIEKRANKRKSLEAHIAMARKSEQIERQNSFSMAGAGRASVSLSRPSIGGLTMGRPSTSARLPSIRDELDGWLRERENDVEVSQTLNNSAYYSPRASAQLSRASMSMSMSELRNSMQWEDYEDLVDEALAVDEPAVIERTFQHINDFATDGLRTLLYGYRFIDDEDYASWHKIYLDATTSLVGRQDKIEKAGELIEQELELAGATAIEDKLQQGVPESIDKLRRANIKLWMLTGDKRETAINIGHSCRLIKDYSTVVVLDHEAGEVEQNIAAALLSLNGGGIAHMVVVIDGQTLAMVEAGNVRNLFYDLAILADSVVCCRASPSQKAGLVKTIRKRVKKSITLAIGDGANDIAMIQEAHVGIGITGKEGLQAARTSDYSIAQFRFLTKLLLVHGRWNYIRTCKYTVGTFWKESLFYLTQALYQRWNGYTGTSLYESWSLSMFNTLFTSLPVIFIGVFEKDLLPSTLLAVPELYTKGQRNGGFNFKIYLGWIFMAASEAMVVFFVMLSIYGDALFTLDNSLFAMGDMTFTACVIIISTKMQLLEMHNKSIVAAISIFLEVGGWFLWNMILAKIYTNNVIYFVRDAFFSRFGRNPLWWLTLILILSAVVIFEIAVASLRAGLWPTDVDTFQALEQDLEIRKRFEEAAATELQQGWDRGKKKSSMEIARDEAEQEAREGQVQEMLDNRPEQLEDQVKPGMRRGTSFGSTRDVPGQGVPRRSTDIERMLHRGFGSVRREHES
ncbi:P-type ATPase [Rhizodiscina lignyota]|uniref:Phospholipid-transporting ATPase n=1 Tax=Rhizodiscina lignyota TaxID=1504668 RepID=A0A9P4IQH3_9PEZI|nr:P-type ATPase [Rhizodiscina lignyota]